MPGFSCLRSTSPYLGHQAAYNKVNGPYCTVNQHLLTKILKDDWGFRGFVVSDWGATHATVASANAVADCYGVKLKSGGHLPDERHP